MQNREMKKVMQICDGSNTHTHTKRKRETYSGASEMNLKRNWA